MNESKHIPRVAPGTLIHLKIKVGERIRDRVIRICKKGESADFTAQPPRHPLTSEFVAPFLNKRRGTTATVSGCRGTTQEPEYQVTLINVFDPEESFDPNLIDSFQIAA